MSKPTIASPAGITDPPPLGSFSMPDAPLTGKAMPPVKASPFKRAVKTGIKLRLALTGVTGGGKTYTALEFAAALGSKVLVLDSEHDSALRYADDFVFDHVSIPKYVCERYEVRSEDLFHPLKYIELLELAAEAGYDVVVIDSATHEWVGVGGCLKLADALKGQSQNQFIAWRIVGPWHDDFVEAVLHAPMHTITTFRSKMEYALTTNEKGKMAPQKMGLAPVTRDGTEYEFDIVGDLDVNHNMGISKSRCSILKQPVYMKPTREFMDKIIPWLGSAEAAIPRAPSIRTGESGEPVAGAEPVPSDGDDSFDAAQLAFCDGLIRFEGKLQANKVQGWLNEKQTFASRAKYTTHESLMACSRGEARAYGEAMLAIAKTLGIVEQDVTLPD
jgi:hypothetical protein